MRILAFTAIFIFGVQAQAKYCGAPRSESLDQFEARLRANLPLANECMALESQIGASLECTQNEPQEVKNYLHKCVHWGNLNDPASRHALLVRKQQLGQLYDQGLNLLGRLQPDSEGYESAWKNFENKWKQRFASEPALINLDEKANLQIRDELSLVGLQKRLAEAIHKIPAASGTVNRTGHNVIQMTLFLRVLEADKRNPEMVAQERDALYAQFPELRMQPAMIDRAFSFIAKQVDVSALANNVAQTIQPGDPLNERIMKRFGATNSAVATAFKNQPPGGWQLGMLERDFNKATLLMNAVLDQEFESGKDGAWLMSRNEYIGPVLARLQDIPGEQKTYAKLAALYCHNAHTQGVRERTMTYAGNTLSAIILVSGGVALAGAAGATAAVFVGGTALQSFAAAAMAWGGGVAMSTGLAVSAEELYTAALAYNQGARLFYLGMEGETQLKGLEQNASRAASDVGIFALSSAPGVIALRVSSTAEKAAVAGQAARAQRLTSEAKQLDRLDLVGEGAFAIENYLEENVEGAVVQLGANSPRGARRIRNLIGK